MFPALGGIATLAALGLGSWLPRRWEKFAPLAVFPLIGAAIALPFAVIRPGYLPPPTVTELPADAVPVGARFGPIELLGVRVDREPVSPGEMLDVTLYWRPTGHTAEDMSLYAQVFGHALPNTSETLAEIGTVDSYPGGGLLRTTTRALDRIYADRYLIRLRTARRRRSSRDPRSAGGASAWREFMPETSSGKRAIPSSQAGRIAGASEQLRGGESVGAVFGG